MNSWTKNLEARTLVSATPCWGAHRGILIVAVIFCVNWADAAEPSKRTEAPVDIPQREHGHRDYAEGGVKSLEDKVKLLEEKDRQSFLASVEAQRKSIESTWQLLAWLTSLLGVAATVVGISGALIPYFMGRRDREEGRRILAEIRAIGDNTRIAQDHVTALRDKARDQVDQISEELQVIRSSQPPERTGGVRSAPDQGVIDAAYKVAEAPEASPLDKLRARAIQVAARATNRRLDDAEHVYRLWSTLAVLDQDASSEFNAGYWAQELYELSSDRATKSGWLRWTERHYRTTLALDPSEYWAAFNWGIALSDEAKAIAHEDLGLARDLWAMAIEKYELALATHKNTHQTALNFGNALDEMARAIFSQEPDAALRLWRDSGEKYSLALQAKSDYHDAAINWANSLLRQSHLLANSDPGLAAARVQEALGILEPRLGTAPIEIGYHYACVLAMAGRVTECLSWLDKVRLEGTLPSLSHMRTDRDLAVIRLNPEYQIWWSNYSE